MVSTGGTQVDQARTPWFRVLLILQLAAAAWFGLFPYLAPALSADSAGYIGSEPLIYRLAGAAALGYAVAAAAALSAPAWHRFRIPAAASYAFNGGAVVAALITLFEGDDNFWVWFIVIAASAFVVTIGYVTRRDQGSPAPAEPVLQRGARVLLMLATLAAAIFGLVPLFAAEWFAALGGFEPVDLFVYRLAGAATFGYAFAGYLSLQSGRWEAIRVQNLAAITFNGLSAIAALMYVMAGGTALGAWVILVAATAFTLGLLVLQVRRGRLFS